MTSAANSANLSLPDDAAQPGFLSLIRCHCHSRRLFQAEQNWSGPDPLSYGARIPRAYLSYQSRLTRDCRLTQLRQHEDGGCSYRHGDFRDSCGCGRRCAGRCHCSRREKHRHLFCRLRRNRSRRQTIARPDCSACERGRDTDSGT